MTPYDVFLVLMLTAGYLIMVISIRAIRRGTPDHTQKRQPYTYRMGRKSDRGF